MAGKFKTSTYSYSNVIWLELGSKIATLAHSEFGVSVKPTSTRWAHYAHHITACPPRFNNLTVSLLIACTFGVHQICSLFCKHPVYFVRGVVQDLQDRISPRFVVQGGHKI